MNKIYRGNWYFKTLTLQGITLLLLLVSCGTWLSAQTYKQDSPYLIELDIPDMRAWALNAPMEKSSEEKSKMILIDLPLPGGQMIPVKIVESPVLIQEEAVQFPEIKTYYFIGIENEKISGRLSLSPRGLDAYIFTPDGDVFIEPLNYGNVMHKVYYVEAGKFPHDVDDRVYYEGYTHKHSETEPEHDHEADGTLKMMSYNIGATLRTFRMHVIADGEYSVAVNGPNPTTAGVMAAIVAAVNSMNALYNRDMAVRLDLTTNTTIYLDPQTDPFVDGGGASDPSWLQESQAHHQLLANNNTVPLNTYDVGHLFSGRVGMGSGGGGVAFVGVVCIDQVQGPGPLKAGGGSGVPMPFGSQWVELLAHEFTHQFNADHTWTGNAGFCTPGQWSTNGVASYEPGSGSTIVSYSGICNDQNIPNPGNINYYHTTSINEVNTYIAGNGNCNGTVATGNQPPTVNANPCNGNVNIPKGTPFELTGSATDDGAANLLTYTWEEFDLAPAQASPIDAPTKPNDPLFRSFFPSSSPTRTFPQLSTLNNNDYNVTGTLTLAQWKGELLPQISRNIKMRLTVRDNNPAGGGVEHDDVTLVVDGNSGPFLVQSPNGGENLMTNTSTAVTWDVANTTAAPVSCANVDILLSTDGGNTYPITLASQTANDGSEMVLIPGTVSPTSNARIKIVCGSSCIKFFDISNVVFNISTGQPSCPNAGDLVITEIMSDPSAVTDANGEWFEVHNTTANPIDMNGMEISDLGSDSHTISGSVVVPANGYIVLTRNSNMATNGGLTAAYQYAGFILGNSDDEIIIKCGGNVIDQVNYDGGPNFPDPTGASMNLDPAQLNATANDMGSNWCESTSTYGTGDKGTPGAMNTSCNPAVCSITAITVSNISACNDQGTSSTSDDTFTANVTVTYANPPGSGTLNLTGDGTAMIAVGSLGSPTMHTFTGVTFSADGGAIALTASFSANQACTFTNSNAGTAPMPCSFTCDIAINSTPTTAPSCPGATDGSITVNASCTTCSGIEYSNGGAFQPGNTFTGLASGSYTITVRGVGNPTCTASQMVIIGAGTDTQAPMINCPAPPVADLSVDANCMASLPDYTAGVASDNCDANPTLNQNPTPGTLVGLGSTTVTLIATDASGNSTSCSFNVNAVDNTSPTAVCLSPTIYLEPNGTYTLLDTDVFDFQNASDNCGPLTVTNINPVEVDCDDYNTIVPVSVTASDGSGNTAQCTAMVNVQKGTALPMGWDNADIGGATGEAEYDPCEMEFCIESNGITFPTSDKIHTAYQYLCASQQMEVIARVVSVSPAHGFGGIMIRESLDGGAKKVALKTQLNGSYFIQRDVRTVTNGFAQSQQIFRPGVTWLRIVRNSNQFLMYTSHNGTSWSFAAFAIVNMNACVYIGLFTEGTNNNVVTEACFDNVSISGGNPVPLIEDNNNTVTDAVRANLTIYPNPAQTEINVNLQDYLGKKAELSIFNSVGQAMKFIEIDRVEMPVQTIKLNSFDNGIYLLKIRSEDEIVTRKFIVSSR